MKPGATSNMGLGFTVVVALLFFIAFFCLCAPCHRPHTSVCGSARSRLGRRHMFLFFIGTRSPIFSRSGSGYEQRPQAASQTWHPCETIAATVAHSASPSGRALLRDTAFVTSSTLSFLPVMPLKFVCVCVHSISLCRRFPPHPPSAGPLWSTGGEFREQPLVVPTQQPSFTEGLIKPDSIPSAAGFIVQASLMLNGN